MRSTLDDYFMRIATEAATRATCDRKHVGCVLVVDKSIVATGYNGSIRGCAHCDDIGHLVENEGCIRTVHAEANAVAQAAKRGASVNVATAYVTHFPCLACFSLLANAGIVRVVYGLDRASGGSVRAAAIEAGIELVKAST